MSAITFSAREMEVLALAWQCMEAQPKIDMTKLAALTGYTPGSASVTFGNIKRKIKLLGEGLAADGPATPKKGGPGRSKGSATPKKRSSSSAAVDDSSSPTKRAKKPSSAKKSRMHDEDEDHEDFAPKVKKEELADLHQSASDFYDQLQDAAQAGFE